MDDNIVLLPNQAPNAFHQKFSCCCTCVKRTLILIFLGLVLTTIYIFCAYRVEFERLDRFGYAIILIRKSIDFNLETVTEITKLLTKMLM